MTKCFWFTLEYDHPVNEFSIWKFRSLRFKAGSEAKARGRVIAFISRTKLGDGQHARYARPRNLIAEMQGLQIPIPWDKIKGRTHYSLDKKDKNVVLFPQVGHTYMPSKQSARA